MLDLGIMQGRLSPPASGRIQSFPESTWREEFRKAAQIGFSHIEWIFQQDGWQQNPIATDKRVDEIRKMVHETSISIHSVCADYFVDVPYLKAGSDEQKELREKLEWLVVQAGKIGARFIDLPFVDASAIGDRKEFSAVREFVALALRRAESVGITIALETSLLPRDFRALLEFLAHSSAMANYDMGNSASLGYDFDEEWASYGRWIRTVHIKDRRLNGPTVPLGTGDAPFKRIFARLLEHHFSGPLVLQAARVGDEVETARKNKLFVEHYLSMLVH